MSWEALIAVSRLLADLPRGLDSDPETETTRLRRAVSTAYYAMFHALARNSADTLVGESATQRATETWRRIYRALEHRTAYRELRESALTDFSTEIKEFGSTFRSLQVWRHRADYDPHSRLSRANTVSLINEAEAAINGLLDASTAERQELTARVLFPSRG